MDEGIDVNINNDQVNDLVDKIFKGISKRVSFKRFSSKRFKYNKIFVNI